MVDEKKSPASNSVGKEKTGFQEPGWKKMESTSAFRAINFELFVKPGKYLIGAGLAVVTGFLAYTGYMIIMSEKHHDPLKHIAEEQKIRHKTQATSRSRWD